MKLEPKKDSIATAYPTASEYDRHMHKVLAACLAVAGAGIAVAGSALADEPKPDPKPEAEKPAKADSGDTKKLTLEKVRKEIKANVEKLGVEDFRVRREATQRLIAIGNCTEKPDPKKPRRSKKPVKPYRDLVVQEMETLAEHKDPEVKERAKLVITALTPKPVSIERPPAMGGVMIAEPIEIIEE